MTSEIEEKVLKEIPNDRRKLIQEFRAWHESGSQLEQEMIDYNWDYRKKICSKCSTEGKIDHGCISFDNFKDGIQETHCQKMIYARTQKFKKKIDLLLEIGFFEIVKNEEYLKKANVIFLLDSAIKETEKLTREECERTTTKEMIREVIIDAQIETAKKIKEGL